jgi:hypothetical protein
MDGSLLYCYIPRYVFEVLWGKKAVPLKFQFKTGANNKPLFSLLHSIFYKLESPAIFTVVRWIHIQSLLEPEVVGLFLV